MISNLSENNKYTGNNAAQNTNSYATTSRYNNTIMRTIDTYI